MNEHLDESTIRAFLDGEIEEAAEIHAHLAICPECQARMASLKARQERVRRHIQSLAPRIRVSAIPTATARAHLSTRLANREKEYRTMWKRLTAPAYRPACIAAAIVLVLGVSLAFPSVRALATDFLGIFRIQQVTAVPVNPQNLPTNLQGVGRKIEQVFKNDFTYKVNGQAEQVMTVGEASRLAGFDVRLPGDTLGNPEITVQPSAHGTFKIDLAQIRPIFQELGRSDVNLPDSLDGAEVTVDLPRSVVSAYGACQKVSTLDEGPQNLPAVPPSYEGKDCTVLIQLPSPTVNAPADLDVNKLGQVFLEMTGMPADQAAQISQKINWSSTLVVPIPVENASYKDVQVDGVSGLLITPKSSEGLNNSLLLWVKNGIIYAFTGSNADTLVSLANSLS